MKLHDAIIKFMSFETYNVELIAIIYTRDEDGNVRRKQSASVSCAFANYSGNGTAKVIIEESDLIEEII